MTPWTVAHQAPLSIEFSRQEYRSGLPFPSPGCKIASGNLLYDSVNTNPMLCDHLEGWDGVGGRRGVQEGEDLCVSMADSY